MPADRPTNEERLRAAGVIKERDLEPQYQALVEGLTRAEVDVIVAVRRRIEEADRVSGWEPGSREDAPSLSILMPL